MAITTSGRRWRTAALPHVDVRLLVGVVLVAAAVIGGVRLADQARITQPVVIAAHAIPAGHVISSDDLTTAQARLDGPPAALAVAAPDLAALVGQTAQQAIPAGALVLRPDLGSVPTIGADQLAVTVPVNADTVYPALHPGDHVTVVATTDKGQPQSQSSTLLDDATVYDVSRATSSVTLGAHDSAAASGRVSNVTLLIPGADAERFADAVVNAQLTLAAAQLAAAAQGTHDERRGDSRSARCSPSATARSSVGWRESFRARASRWSPAASARPTCWSRRGRRAWTSRWSLPTCTS